MRDLERPSDLERKQLEDEYMRLRVAIADALHAADNGHPLSAVVGRLRATYDHLEDDR